ncbi:hypothetical protein BC936DRAFT_143328 [Jimgerdemannia flammicorona]|uniref:Uncharacterized protein n=1 Tax=Jimgerdemannia flammicorona TaxID=994334 RepID=A0A433DE27_9FUNG|nr:hypothetical protein BC936DRAFT_143328 [Jimgerdemannia flammicorona]
MFESFQNKLENNPLGNHKYQIVLLNGCGNLELAASGTDNECHVACGWTLSQWGTLLGNIEVKRALAGITEESDAIALGSISRLCRGGEIACAHVWDGCERQKQEWGNAAPLGRKVRVC